MRAIATRSSLSLLVFVGIALGVYVTAAAVAGRLAAVERAGIVAVALTLDMVIIVPAVFYLLVVRRRNLPVVTLAPVFVLSVVAASRVLPADHQQLVRSLEIVAFPAELGLLGWVGWRAARAVRRARRDAPADPLEQFRLAAFQLTRNERIAAVFAMEIGVFYYALASWWARPHVPVGAIAITQHRRSSHGGTVVVLLLVLAAEGWAVHAVLREWNALVAWLFTASTVYAALWLIADYRATVLRPTLSREHDLLIRAGFRATLSVPRACIADAGRTKPPYGKQCLSLTFLRAPARWVTLSEPLFARGPYGFRRQVRAIGFEPDAIAAFDRMLASLIRERRDSIR